MTAARSDLMALKPCPFCGGEPSVADASWVEGAAMIYCAGEECMGPRTTAASLQDATVQWNTRAGAGTAVGPEVREALEALIGYVERNECAHEGTHRGGAIWTICDCCGKKWADDRGGFVPYVEPVELVNAKAALTRPLGGFVQGSIARKQSTDTEGSSRTDTAGGAV